MTGRPQTRLHRGRRLHGRPALTLGLAAIWPPAIVVGASRLVWAGSLPDRIASHWRGSARPDGISSTSGMFVAALTVTIVGAVIATTAVLVRRHSPTIADVGILVGPLVAAPVAGSWLISVWARMAAGSAENATLGLRILLIVPALALGLVPIALLRQSSHGSDPRVPARDLDLDPGERAAWSEVVGGRVFVVTAALLALAAVVVGLIAEPWTGAILAAAAILTAAFGRTEVTADHRGLRLRSWILGIPFRRIPLEDIAEAHTEFIDPMRWGGWATGSHPAGRRWSCTPGPGW